jgi:arylsulfatase A-like enzyme
LLTLPAAADPKHATQPNILFIMTDDHASHSISAYGSKVNITPHLDKLAADGVRFNNAFVTNSICTPSRATLLTGKYSHLNGTPVFNTFDGQQQTVAKLMQAAGYYTVMTGKWRLGSDPTGRTGGQALWVYSQLKSGVPITSSPASASRSNARMQGFTSSRASLQNQTQALSIGYVLAQKRIGSSPSPQNPPTPDWGKVSAP